MEWMLRRWVSLGDALLMRRGRGVRDGSTPARGIGQIMVGTRLEEVEWSPDTTDAIEGVRGRGDSGGPGFSIRSTIVS